MPTPADVTTATQWSALSAMPGVAVALQRGQAVAPRPAQRDGGGSPSGSDTMSTPSPSGPGVATMASALPAFFDSQGRRDSV
ncbi:Uncharacterised protein [Bordetella pertussis]|nr:Uncharacterised protein [Bordetella pertussis]CPJ91444.1 Uncharacterised protein [Bordetella pertussis]CPK05003.1 Uncharacterised protein [Bordetella pertussis]